MKDFGFTQRKTRFDTIAYLQASEKWEKDLNTAIKRCIAAEENLKNIRSQKPYPGKFKFKSTPVEWNKEGYEKAMDEFKAVINTNPSKGIQRTRPIDPSWNEVLKLFDSSNPQRSQGAFCRWAGINRTSFSSKQVKPLGDDMERFILEWVGVLELREAEMKVWDNSDQIIAKFYGHE